MNPSEMLRIVDSLHRDKNIDKEIVFQAIESAMVTAARRQYGDEADIQLHINREDGSIEGTVNSEPLDPDAVGIGRIGAQTAKQIIIQKIREAERDSLISEFKDQIGQMVTGTVQRAEGGATIVSLSNVEAILPRSEQILGEPHHPNERVRAVICEVKPQGSRVKVVLSRTRPQLVERLFEQEIPEIADGVITIQGIAREPGFRSKVAVSSSDQRVDCVGACVGVRGNRIKNIVEELSNERIDIVRWSEDKQVLIPNALQPAEVEQVLLCEMIGRAIVLVREDQLSLAIGRKGQNVRLASKLCGIDIEIMTADELDEQIERAVTGFQHIDGVSEELAQALVEQGYLSYDDLSVIEPDELMEMGGLTAEQVDHIVSQAEELAEQAERAVAEARRRQKELDRQQVEAPAEPQAAQPDQQQPDQQQPDQQQPDQPPNEQAADHQTAAAQDAAEGQATTETSEAMTTEPASESDAEEASAETRTEAESETTEPAAANDEESASGAGDDESPTNGSARDEAETPVDDSEIKSNP